MTSDDIRTGDEGGGETDVGAAVITVSNDRSLEDDPAGAAITDAFEGAGHEVVTRERIQPNYDNVQSIVSRLVDRDDVDIVVTAGGAGIEPEDATLEAVRPLVDKELPAYADYFHRLSFDDVGSRGICRRTLGGVADGVPIFCLPGLEAAARLGAERIVVPEAADLVARANGGETDETDAGP